MKFSAFNESNRDQFDQRTISDFELLQEKFGTVEFKSVSKSEKCVRIVADVGYLPTPLAALGKTYAEAAERLICVSKGLKPLDPK